MGDAYSVQIGRIAPTLLPTEKYYVLTNESRLGSRQVKATLGSSRVRLNVMNPARLVRQDVVFLAVASICRDIGEALVSFANADGGELLGGVEDEDLYRTTLTRVIAMSNRIY